ncbi:uncharacterized protein EI97DRAFT_117646 [Westerdykella ornata]|uniref:Uncharacterized protein n=1 Tax=Westerdykella ornata TaxID=318751 RepID=A0A6A6JUI9_WESOR|nr:uncharacterized protein EI97DRAFT_117646 [Westerdykella ornata]KAF2280280.1 hypothetical protein EI97DRAFT_117646 [Westerdykella ornata]
MSQILHVRSRGNWAEVMSTADSDSSHWHHCEGSEAGRGLRAPLGKAESEAYSVDWDQHSHKSRLKLKIWLGSFKPLLCTDLINPRHPSQFPLPSSSLQYNITTLTGPQLFSPSPCRPNCSAFQLPPVRSIRLRQSGSGYLSPLAVDHQAQPHPTAPGLSRFYLLQPSPPPVRPPVFPYTGFPGLPYSVHTKQHPAATTKTSGSSSNAAGRPCQTPFCGPITTASGIGPTEERDQPC